VHTLQICVTRNPCKKMLRKKHIHWTRTNMPKIVSCHETGRTFPPSSSVSVNFINSRLMTDSGLNYTHKIIEQKAVNTTILFIVLTSATHFNHKGTPSGYNTNKSKYRGYIQLHYVTAVTHNTSRIKIYTNLKTKQNLHRRLAMCRPHTQWAMTNV